MKDFKLIAGIHTLEIVYDKPILKTDIEQDVLQCYDRITIIKNGTGTKFVINPNKLSGDIFSYSEFKTALNTILAGAGIDTYIFTRIDFRLDSYEPEHYYKYKKLYRYLISAMSKIRIFKNKYLTEELISGKQISVSIKNDYIELEHYDRGHKSQITGNVMEHAKSRLEERTKRFGSKDIKNEFRVAWFAKWDEAVKSLILAEQAYNTELVQQYKQEKEIFPKRFTNIREFIRQNQDRIFSKRQLIDFLDKINAHNPTVIERNFKSDSGIEYITGKDVEAAVAEIKRATAAFFES